MKKDIKNQLIPLSIGVLFLCFLFVLFTFAWTGPSGVPPDSNAPAPINVGSSGQEKEGQLGISIPSGEFLDPSYGLTVGTASNPLGIKSSDDLWIEGKLTGIKPTGVFCGDNQVLKFNSLTSNWICADDTGGGGSWVDDGTVVRLETATDNVGIGTTAPSYKLHTTGDIYADGGWLRTNGSRGWYNETHGGGMYMTDSTWLRTYNNKSIYSGTGIIRSDASVRAPIFYDQNNTGYYVDPAGTSNLYAIEANGPIDANQNYIYGQRCCWNVVIDAIGGFSNTPKGYCWDALGSYYSPVAVSCQNVQEVTALPNACNSSGDDHCYFFSNEVSVLNVCDYSTGGDAVISCCKTRGTCGVTP